MSLPLPPERVVRDGPTLKAISRPASARAAGKNSTGLSPPLVNERIGNAATAMRAAA